MKKTALITGASSGIGKELARLHASKYGDLVLVARRKEALQELKTELEKKHGIQVLVIQKDLSKPGAATEVYEEVIAAGIDIEYLINNAGFGGHGKFHERNWTSDQQMIQLNIMALTELTRMFLPDMVKRNKGKILNSASTAGYLPGPLQAVYFATKAYVISFGLAISEELSDTNITVTSLCPGPVETEFASVANAEDTKLFKNAESAKSVASKGYAGMEKGKLEVITNLSLKIQLKFLTPFVPNKLILKASRSVMEKND
ncbi:MAG: SDR family oxidoreductase [Bacteroidota bacterium]|nr:SDR family oxidoreductase [Bacteroidota bacterium]